MIRLTGIFIYPIKSARGISLSEASAKAAGFLHDRRFMLVDPEGAFVTQRELPQLAQLVPEIAPPALGLSFPDLPPLRVPLVPERGESRRVRVWNDSVEALDLGAEAAAWLSQALGRALSLVYMPETTQRAVSLDYGQPGDQTAFSDGYPYLLASESSLGDLNARLSSPVEMSRFRPNLVIEGAEAFAEDRWAQLELGALHFDVVKPCTRCVITTADPVTGVRTGPEPLATLARYRLWKNKPIFAQNLIPRAEGLVRVGDQVRVVSTREPV